VAQAEEAKRAQAAAEERRRQEAEALALAQAEAAAAEAAAAIASAQVVSVTAPVEPPATAPVDLFGPAPVQPEPSEPANIKLGEICRHLGIIMTSDFVAETLGIPHRATDKAAKLYTATDAKNIAMALAAHAQAKAAQEIK
jgi:hypothetical protein